MKDSIFLHYLLVAFLILEICSCNPKGHYLEKDKIKSFQISGQSAPPDMIFVPGKDHIPPFFVSITEEPNVNYVIYLNWLNSIYGESYPEVVKAALPKANNLLYNYDYNDPFLQAYMTNPAFAYYPVTNLTWRQIDHYLAWKTDRLNEAILIEKGFLNFNLEQRDEDSFNSDAYLCDQYQGDVRKNIIIPQGERKVELNDGILFTGFRLPTEAEWEYLLDFEDTQLKKKRSFDQHPYGKKYFTLNWGRTFENVADYDYRDVLPQGFRNYQIDAKVEKQPTINTSDDKPYFSITDYERNANAIIDLKGGVKELLLNEYAEDRENDIYKNWLEVIQSSGIKVNSNLNRDENGSYVEKDFMGRMNNFRFIDVDANGNPIEIERDPQLGLEKRMEQLTQNIINLEQNLTALKIVSSEDVKLDQIETKLNERREKMIHNLERQVEHMNSDNDYYNIQREINTLYQERDNSRTVRQQYFEKQLRAAKQSLASLKSNAAKLKATKKYRLVKGGDWQNPGTFRDSIREDQAAHNVGFRTILPYTGIPVKRKNKVKW